MLFYSILPHMQENIARAKQEKMQTSAEMMAEREKRVEENIPQIRISAHDSEERLREIAEILHAKLVEVYSDMYDLEQRKERQEYDVRRLMMICLFVSFCLTDQRKHFYACKY